MAWSRALPTGDMPIIQYVLVYLVTGRPTGGSDSELSSLITLVDGLHSENATQEAKQSNISMNSMARQLSILAMPLFIQLSLTPPSCPVR